MAGSRGLLHPAIPKVGRAHALDLVSAGKELIVTGARLRAPTKFQFPCNQTVLHGEIAPSTEHTGPICCSVVLGVELPDVDARCG